MMQTAATFLACALYSYALERLPEVALVSMLLSSTMAPSLAQICCQKILHGCAVTESFWPSLQLKLALEEILNLEGAVRPKAVRFFRAQMQTIITRALNDLDIKPVPSRRCFTLLCEPLATLQQKQICLHCI